MRTKAAPVLVFEESDQVRQAALQSLSDSMRIVEKLPRAGVEFRVKQL